MSCEQVKTRLSLYLYGELSFDEEEALEQHLDVCEDCRRALDSEKNWHSAVNLREAEAAPELLVECRKRLEHRLAVESGSLKPASRWTWLRNFGSITYLRPAGAVALLAVGFIAARITTPQQQALYHLGAPQPGPVATRVRWVEPDPAGGVRIPLDETRQRTLSGRLENQAIQRLLVSTVSDSSDPGLRVDSVDILNSHAASAEVRKVLLRALRQDPNSGVRLKAIEGLKSFAGDAEVRDALANALLEDDNPTIRTVAIDLLVKHVEADMAGVLQEALRRDNNDYVRLRCEKALRDMNASIGTF